MSNQEYADFFTYSYKASKIFEENGVDVNIKKIYECFSNYYPAEIVYENTTFFTNEHAFHWKKFDNEWYREIIRTAYTPHESKELGGQRFSKYTRLYIINAIKEAKDRNITLRNDWYIYRNIVMYEINLAKFTQHKHLRDILLSTGNKIIREASPYDSYWGIGPDGKGKNKLGKILMKIREELRTT
jgi:N-glycosidase YbiA